MLAAPPSSAASAERERERDMVALFLDPLLRCKAIIPLVRLWVNQLVLRPPHNRLPTSHLTTTAAKLSISLKLPAAPPHTPKKTPTMPYQAVLAAFRCHQDMMWFCQPHVRASTTYPAVEFYLLSRRQLHLCHGASAALCLFFSHVRFDFFLD
jgi:hypothetical protein